MRRWQLLITSAQVLLASLLAAAPAGAQSGESAAWSEARQAGTADAYESFLRNYPRSQYATEAFRCLVSERVRGAGDACPTMSIGRPEVSGRNPRQLAGLY